MGKGPTTRQQVKSGFRIAGAWLLGGAWLFLVFGGMMEVGIGTEASLSARQAPSRPLGYLLLAAAVVIFVLTANRWKRAFPGIMLAATLGALLELESGHAVNLPSVHIPRSVALVQLLAIAGITALSFDFKKRALNALDRIALLILAASIFAGGWEAVSGRMPLALAGGGACLFGAWTYARLRLRRRHGGEHGPSPTHRARA